MILAYATKVQDDKLDLGIIGCRNVECSQQTTALLATGLEAVRYDSALSRFDAPRITLTPRGQLIVASAASNERPGTESTVIVCTTTRCGT